MKTPQKVIGLKMTKNYCKGVEYFISNEQEFKRAIDACEVVEVKQKIKKWTSKSKG